MVGKMNKNKSTSEIVLAEQVAGMIEELKLLGAYDKFISASEHICITTPLGSSDFLSELQNAFRNNGIESSIKNALVLSRRRKELVEEQETLGYMKKAQAHFERRVSKALVNLHTELKLSLVRPRSNSESQELASKWEELSTYDQDISSIRNLYSAKDLYDAVISLRDPDYIINRVEERWNAVKVPLSVLTFEEIQAKFKDMCTCDEPYLGLCSNLVLQGTSNASLLNLRIQLGIKVIAENDILVTEEFVKGGCPSHLRGQLWKQILQCNVGEKEKTYFQAKRQAVIQTDYLTDKIIIKDIQLTASRDEHYFVFEDLVYQVSLCFSRDPFVCQQLSLKFGTKTSSRHAQLDIPGHTGQAFPPSSCIPFYGWAMYVAPLCYVFEEAEDIYYTLRSMYIKFWSRLHRISSSSQGLVALSITFERLLQQQEPELWMHCINNNIEPLKVALPWLVQAFSGYLNPDQLLFLWDLILGFDSLLILPLLASSVFSLRRDNLHRVTAQETAESVLSDLSTIQVVPLLQMALAQQVN